MGKSSVSALSAIDESVLAEVAVIPKSANRSATFILRDNSNLCCFSCVEGVEFLPIAEGLRKHDRLAKRLGISCARNPCGYFLKVQKGRKVTMPIQAAIYMSGLQERQELHNVVILEEDSRVELITGCASNPEHGRGKHISFSDIWIGKGAVLVHTMLHSLSQKVEISTRSSTIVKNYGSLESNFVTLRPSVHAEYSPKVILDGVGSTAKLYSVVLGAKGSTVVIGGEVKLNGEGASAEIEHKAVCTGGKILQKGNLIGNSACKGHIDCSGIVVPSVGNGYIESLPGLLSQHPDAQLSHEASIGKIAPQQVEYLMAREVGEQDAISMIVRGFLGAGLSGLGTDIEEQISKLVRMSYGGAPQW